MNWIDVTGHSELNHMKNHSAPIDTNSSSSSSGSQSASTPSTLAAPSTLPNAQLLLTNPWLHTSLLYSQLYSHRLQSQQLGAAAAAAAAAGAATPAAVSDNDLSAAAAAAARSQRSASASPSSPTPRDEVDSKKRSDVWRPY